jgi:trans-2,3-dihydro-3-hydroxyanthranilate isomerase
MRSYAIADVFTEVPLEGNPVAVFTDADGLTPEVMQRAARELNLSETVFLTPDGGDAHVRARIFTPASELPFAGHPVLGSAFVFAGPLGMEEVRIRTGAGVVPVTLRWEGDRVVSGEMAQPLPTWEPFAEPGRLLAALGVSASELPIEVYDNGPRHAFVALAGAADVAGVAPDFRALSALGELGVSCFAATGTRVKTRMFAPGLGVSEDPATGSAAGPLVVHLARHGRVGFGDPIEIVQGAEIGRPSFLRAVVEGSPQEIERVMVAGSAVIVARGEYRLD